VNDGTPGGPVATDEHAAPPPAANGPRRRAIRVSSFAILMVAFALLAGAAGAAAWGQLKTGTVGPLLSIGLSVGAVLLTIVAIWLRPTR
jgi:hypothetical protein